MVGRSNSPCILMYFCQAKRYFKKKSSDFKIFPKKFQNFKLKILADVMMSSTKNLKFRPIQAFINTIIQNFDWFLLSNKTWKIRVIKCFTKKLIKTKSSRWYPKYWNSDCTNFFALFTKLSRFFFLIEKIGLLKSITAWAKKFALKLCTCPPKIDFLGKFSLKSLNNPKNRYKGKDI